PFVQRTGLAFPAASSAMPTTSVPALTPRARPFLPPMPGSVRTRPEGSRTNARSAWPPVGWTDPTIVPSAPTPNASESPAGRPGPRLAEEGVREAALPRERAARGVPRRGEREAVGRGPAEGAQVVDRRHLASRAPASRCAAGAGAILSRGPRAQDQLASGVTR